MFEQMKDKYRTYLPEELSQQELAKKTASTEDTHLY